MSPRDRQSQYGASSTQINSMRPFQVSTSVSGSGEMTIELNQDGRKYTSFDKRMAGNPQGSGVPTKALRAIKSSMGKLALVASLWSSDDLSWLDGPGCNRCDLETAQFTIGHLKVGTGPEPPPPPPMPPVLPPIDMSNLAALEGQGAAMSTSANPLRWPASAVVGARAHVTRMSALAPAQLAWGRTIVGAATHACT